MKLKHLHIPSGRLFCISFLKLKKCAKYLTLQPISKTFYLKFMVPQKEKK